MKQITKSEINPPERPGDGWHIIETAGEFMNGDVRQTLTPETLERIAAAGVPPEGLPIDKDHLSLQTDQTTEAMGWVKELATCEGNLAARIEWTPPGLALITGKVYKHFSTVYPAPEAGQEAAYAPERLIGLALTNHPNNAEGQPPITNSRAADRAQDGNPAAGYTCADARAYLESDEAAMEKEQQPTQNNFHPAQGAAGEETKPNNTMTYPKELLDMLSLAEGATDDEVIAALRAALQGPEADSIINTEEQEEGVKLDDEEREDVREELITNRERGIRYLKALCQAKRNAPQTAAPVANRGRLYGGTGKMPDVMANKTDAAAARAQAIANRAIEIAREANARGERTSYWAALNKAKQEL